MKDYYKILNIPPFSEEKIIKKSYFNLARKFHPDKNKSPEAEEMFKEISAAYQVLSDKEKRKLYDDQRKVFENHQFQNQKNSHKKNKERKNLDSSTCLQITLEEAHTGCEKKIMFYRENRGIKEKQKIGIKIPPGVTHGKKLKLLGQSHREKGRAGDIFVEIKIKKHPLFELQDRNVVMRLPVSLSDAVLGAYKTIPTLTGKAQITLRPGIQPGTLLILKNQGFSYPNGLKRGDLILEIHVDIPSQITEEEKQWFKKFRLKEVLSPPQAKFNIQAQKLFLKRAS